MKTLALTTSVFALSISGLMAQSQSDIEFLRARADAQERKISQLESTLTQLKSYHVHKQTTRPSVPSAKAPAAGEYLVKSGDVLSRIAYRHHTTVAVIKKANNLRNDNLKIGQKLRIPLAQSCAVSEKKPVVESSTSLSAVSHRVQNGETFYSIARQHGVSLQSLIAANSSIVPANLRPGQTLVVDGSAKPKPQRKRVVKNTPEPAVKKSAPEPKREVVREDSAPAQKSSDSAIRTITVNNQMTYGQFANKHGANTNQLNALNGLNLNKNTMLAKGSELYVPQF